MGRKALPTHAIETLRFMIAVFRAQTDQTVGSLEITVKSSLAAVEEQLVANAKSLACLKRFTGEHGAVDADTFDALNPLATDTQLALELFNRRLEHRKLELEAHPRVNPKAEALRYFCAMLSRFFREYANPGFKIGPPGRRRHFVLTVLSEASVDHPEFQNQPNRLDELCDTFIPLQDLPPDWVWAAGKRSGT